MFLLDYVLSPDLPEAFETTLGNGTPVQVRHVSAADAPRLKEGFKRVSALARRRHFPEDETDELSDEQLKQLAQLDQKNYVIWGALNPAKPDEPGVGIARYQRLKDERDTADVAITIMEQYQGTGAGLLLHACLHLTACRNNIRSFYYDVDGENERFIRHLKNLGAEHVGRVVGITRLKLPVFARAIQVPKHNASGWKFAQTIRRLSSVRAVSG